MLNVTTERAVESRPAATQTSYASGKPGLVHSYQILKMNALFDEPSTHSCVSTWTLDYANLRLECGHAITCSRRRRFFELKFRPRHHRPNRENTDIQSISQQSFSRALAWFATAAEILIKGFLAVVTALEYSGALGSELQGISGSSS